ncbi:ATP-binding protein, partial [Striga asiatica]
MKGILYPTYLTRVSSLSYPNLKYKYQPPGIYASLRDVEFHMYGYFKHFYNRGYGFFEYLSLIAHATLPLRYALGLPFVPGQQYQYPWHLLVVNGPQNLNLASSVKVYEALNSTFCLDEVRVRLDDQENVQRYCALGSPLDARFNGHQNLNLASSVKVYEALNGTFCLDEVRVRLDGQGNIQCTMGLLFYGDLFPHPANIQLPLEDLQHSHSTRFI